MEEIIKVQNLTKSYNNRIVLNNLSFSLEKGESLGILGSNGAGKTTLLETIEGLRKIETGYVTVLGQNVMNDYKSIQSKIGIQLQKTSLFNDLNVKENIMLYSKLFNKKHNVESLLDEFDLTKQKKVEVKNLSGGQFQRLNLCIAMINEPLVLFLDEPTTGLDPKARFLLWEKIKFLKQQGTSIVLTTHYMEEAQNLCDRIIIIHDGTFIANDTPANLIKQLNAPRIITLEVENEIIPGWFEKCDVRIFNKCVYVRTTDVGKEMMKVLKIIEKNNIDVINISIHESNLEDVYMELTKVKLENGNIVS